MKKIFTFILSLLYLVNSNGATINFHYCMGKFTGWDVSIPVNKKCSNCGMTKENQKGCCNDKHHTFKPIKEQISTAEIATPTTIYYSDNSFAVAEYTYPIAFVSPFYAAHSPPLQTKPLYLLQRVFRI